MTEIILDRSGMIGTKIEIVSPTKFNVMRFQDVEPILDANKRDQNDRDFLNGYTEGRDMKHVARIPIVVLELWAKESGIKRKNIFGKEMGEVIRKKLNDPDNSFLRTGMGRI